MEKHGLTYIKCSKCGETKDSSRFNLKSKDYWCRDCKNAYYRLDYKKNKELRVKAVIKCYIKRQYNLTVEEYEGYKEQQNNCCAICKEPAKLAMDHNHTTGRVRAMLCKPCNSALGLLKENKDTMKSMIEYVEKYN